MSFLKDIATQVDEEDRICDRLLALSYKRTLNKDEYFEAIQAIKSKTIPLYMLMSKMTLTNCIDYGHESIALEIFDRDDFDSYNWLNSLLHSTRIENIRIVRHLLNLANKHDVRHEEIWEGILSKPSSLSMQAFLIIFHEHMQLNISEIPDKRRLTKPMIHIILEARKELTKKDIVKMVTISSKQDIGLITAYLGQHAHWEAAMKSINSSWNPSSKDKIIRHSPGDDDFRKLAITHDAYSGIACRLFLTVVALCDGYLP